MASPAKVILVSCLLVALSMQMCSGSAIPIWEFLTRNEKMSYLYSTFAQLVSVHCKATAATSTLPVNQCKHNLLSYGYEKLQTFSDAQLDAMDPYQRDANELIWSAIMRDHPSATLITTRKPIPTPPASSIVILTHQKPSTTATHEQYPQNPLFANNAEHKHKFAMDMDYAYGYANPQTEVTAASGATTATTTTEHKTYLTGPLVIRVRPDGTPVDEDQYRPLPRDDDLEVYQITTTGSNTQTGATVSGGRTNKHRKIATINALKQQHFAAQALQRELQPPLVAQRRQFRQVDSYPATGGYYYAKSLA